MSRGMEPHSARTPELVRPEPAATRAVDLQAVVQLLDRIGTFSTISCPGSARTRRSFSIARPGRMPRHSLARGPLLVRRGPVSQGVSSKGLGNVSGRANTGRLWPPQRRPRPPHTAPGRGSGGDGSHRSTLPQPALRMPDHRINQDRLGRLASTAAVPVHATATAGRAQRDPVGGAVATPVVAARVHQRLHQPGLQSGSGAASPPPTARGRAPARHWRGSSPRPTAATGSGCC